MGEAVCHAVELAADGAVRPAAVKFGIAGKSEPVDEVQKTAIEAQRAPERQSVPVIIRHQNVARRGADVAGGNQLPLQLPQTADFGLATLAAVLQIGRMN
jgi:hypothetical protein